MQTFFTFIFLVFLIFGKLCSAQTEFEELIRYYNSEKNFSGVVLVATNGITDYLGYAGMSDIRNKIPFSKDTKFKIASMTKVFTAVIVMKLVEDGRLNLDSPVGTYFPDYKGEGRDKVTLHHLLTYSSGIENQADALGMRPYQTKHSIDDFIDKYCSGKLIKEPGSESNYSNTEYIILHKIIESVTGRSYEENLEAMILRPLGLKNTGMCNSDIIMNDLTISYTYNDSLNALNEDEPFLPEMYFGSGFMYSTAEDMLNFDKAIFENVILNSGSTAKLLAINKVLGYTAYGFWGSDGWGSFDEKFYYRTGGILGSTSNWIHTMKTGKSIIILSNTNAVDLYGLSEKLYLISTNR